MTLKRCSAKNCVSNGTPCPVAFMFKFPRDLDRCKIWVKNSGNEKLLKGPSRRLCVRSYLCTNHFEEDQFFDKFRRRLKRNAIPTIFSSMPLSDDIMSKFPVFEDPLNAIYDEVRHSTLKTLCNRYNSFSLPCSRNFYNKSGNFNVVPPIVENAQSKEPEYLSSATEVLPFVSQGNSIDSSQEEQDYSHTKIKIPSESSINGINLMPGPGSITYIEGPWSKEPEVKNPISVQIFEDPNQDSSDPVCDGLVEHSSNGQCQENFLHHLNVQTDENYENLFNETFLVPTTPISCECESANFETSCVHCTEFAILDSNQTSSDIENALSSTSNKGYFVIQSKQLTNGGQVRVAYSAPDDVFH